MTLSEILKSISRSEWRFVALVALASIVISSAPYLVAVLSPHPGTFYAGTHVLSQGDTPVYYSYIRAAADGAFVFRDVFTSEPHAAFNLNTFWVPVGWLVRFFSISAPLAFHLARMLAIPPFFAVLYPFIAFIFPDARRRKLALLLTIFASGFGGWVFVPIMLRDPLAAFHGSLPMDLWVPEAFPFLSFLQTGHFTFGTTLLIVFFFGLLLAWKTDRLRYSLAAGLAAFVLFSFHPFHLVTFAAVAAAWGTVACCRFHAPWRSVAYHAGIAALVALPTALAQVLLTAVNPIAAGRAAQNILPSPQWWAVALSYGLLLVGALWMLPQPRTWRNERLAFLCVWAFAQFSLLFFPVFFQRRLSQGLSLPLALLTTEALVQAWSASQRRQSIALWLRSNAFVVLMALTMLLSFSNLVVLGEDFLYFTTPRTKNFPFSYYLSEDYARIAERLRQSDAPTVVLTAVTSGTNLAGLSGRTVYIGHSVETLDFKTKLARVRRFFANEAPAEQERWLRDSRITHLLWGEWERQLGSFDPRTKPYLAVVYEGRSASLYRVVPER